MLNELTTCNQVYLVTGYTELSNPKACQAVLNTYKGFNDPVREFVAEVFDDLVWDVVPLAYLYDLYKAWLSKTNPGGAPLGKKTFNMTLASHAPNIAGWDFTPDRIYPSLNAMQRAEPLTCYYELRDWYNPSFNGSVTGPTCGKFIPQVKKHYNGAFLRQSPGVILGPGWSKRTA